MEEELAALRSLASGAESRTEKARRAAALIRALGSYRWTGLYDVSAAEIAVIAWEGPEAPTHPRFPIAEGLNGAAVSSGRPVIVQDVARDPRYLTTIGGTRGEMIQPVVGKSGAVVGTIDVESDRVNAFSASDEARLAACADSLRWLWEQWTARPAQLADAAEMARLAGELGYPLRAEEMRARLEKLLSTSTHYVAAVGDPDRLLGWTHVEHRVSLEGGERAEIVGLVVDSAARRGGVGRLLVAAAEEWAAARGTPQITVRSNVARELSHPFYEALGYLRHKTQHVYQKALK